MALDKELQQELPTLTLFTKHAKQTSLIHFYSFIMVKDQVDPEPVLDTISVRWEYILEGMPVIVGHCVHTNSHVDSQSSVLYEVEGKWRHH